jgi:hypothetical protein
MGCLLFPPPSCSALIRPGRFDMQVTVPKPDVKGRTEILNWYLKKIKVDQGREDPLKFISCVMDFTMCYFVYRIRCATFLMCNIISSFLFKHTLLRCIISVSFGCNF